MSMKTKQICEAIYADRHQLEGIIVVAFAPGGTTHVDMGGVVEGSAKLFLHAISVLASIGSGVEVRQLGRADPEDVPPAIILPGKGSS